MPGFDGTGPEGYGARTGRSMGNCVGDNDTRQVDNSTVGKRSGILGVGRGGRPRGGGRGHCYGGGRRRRGFRGWGGRFANRTDEVD